MSKMPDMALLATYEAGGKFRPGAGGDHASSSNNRIETVNSKTVTATRRSKRQPKPIIRVSSSDDDDDDDGSSSIKKRPRKNPPKRIPTRRVIGPIDSDGKPFCCDKCQSPYVIDPKKSCKAEANKLPGPRYKIEPESGKRLKLCNACGLAFDRTQRKPARPKPRPPTEEDKQKYAEDADKFANSLVEGLGDPDAARLACPHFGQKPCGCIQRYVMEEGDMEDSREKANGLLQILKQAKKLKDKKCYNVDEVISRGKKHRKVGLGNGQKKSKEFEEFVLTNRKYLRDDVKLCERATQRILLYSNNFLHKKLKTEPERTRRIERTRGQAALGLLKAISELPEEKCCEDCCVLLAKTHSVLLTEWRERAVSGQAEARKVLAEMLTPSGLRSNCYKFINLVTGCSLSTITRVSEQMKATGGNREPPPHGLCKYWEENPQKRQRKLSTSNDIPTYRAPPSQLPVSLSIMRSPPSPGSPTLTQAQLKEQQAQLKRLQQQLDERQRQVTQQQNMVERQLQQYKLASQQKQQKKQQQQQQQQQQQEQLRLQEQVLLQQNQLQEQQEQQQQQMEEQEQEHEVPQVSETQTIVQEQPNMQPATSIITQSIPVSLTPATAQCLPAGAILPATLPAALDGLNPQVLQQNMQNLLSEIASQITQQQQNMQQLLIEMQNELTAQQIQQLTNLATNASPTSATTNLNNAVTSQPPPYPVAVALNAVNASQGQQVQTTSSNSGIVNPAVTSSGQQGPHVIIQAIPALQQNVLLGNATLTSQLLNNAADAQDQSQQETVSATTAAQLHGQTYPQQILVSLAPSLNQDTLTPSSLTQSGITQDALNPHEIVEIQFQDVPPNQEITQDQSSQDRQVSNEIQDAFAQQIRLAGLNFGNQELRAALGGTLPSISQPQTFTTRNKSVRIPNLDPSPDLTGDSTRQTISLLQQGSEVGTSQTVPVETLLQNVSPEALQIFGSAVNQNLVLQPILSPSVSKQNAVQTSQ